MNKVEARRRLLAWMVQHAMCRHYGYETSRASGVRPGRMYPLLTELMEQGYVTDGWDEPKPGVRHPRRYYVFTDLGRAHFIHGGGS